MKKLFAVLLALALVLSMGTIAFAEGETGSITIKEAIATAKYDVYRVFDLESYDQATGNYSYKLSAKWAGFDKVDGIDDYFVINSNGYVEWKASDKNDSDDVKAFVEAAFDYATKNSIVVDGTTTASGNTATIGSLPLGYYLVDTNVGTFCAITTNDPDAEVEEKNDQPSIDKLVQEDRDGSWGKVNDADIDQKVNYKSTITIGYGAVNYVMHDTMEDGLTFNNDIIVKLPDGDDVDTEEDIVDAKNYIIEVNPEDKHTFDIKFDNEFIAGLAKDTELTVYYSATLNEDANIVTDGNDNTVYLKYGEKNEWTTNEAKTTTYTWKMDVLKWAKGEADAKNPLAGAKFQLIGEDGVAIKLTAVEGKTVPTYIVDKDSTIDTIETDSTGKFEIIGLDEGSYKLRETEAPEGYNKLANDTTVIISSTHSDADLTATYEIDDKTPATIEVENKTGTLLPSTGGIGTTIFYVVGITLMLGAGIILISKKRMASFA